jgi:CheY-like chemotaxis protein
MPKLLVRHPEQGDLVFTLSGDRITIGRHSDNQIQIRHGTISGYHAELIRCDSHFLIRDLDSTNHSYVEGIMFIEAELDRACRLVLGTVECDFLPDNVETIPEEIGSLRKTVGLLRRQNDELIAKVAEQKNQIDILGSVKMFTRGAATDLSNLRQQVKELTLDRDSLQEENRALCEELHELRAITGRSGAVQVARLAGGGDVGGGVVHSRFALPIGETVMVPSPLAVMPAPALESPFQEIAVLTGKLRTRAAMLALHPADRNAFEDIVTLAKEMCRIAAILGPHPVAAITAALDALLHDAGHHPPPIGQGAMQTAMQALDFLSRLLTHDVLARAEKLPPSVVVAVDDDTDLLPAIIASLEFANLAAIGSSDARNALDTLQDNHCDVILLDIGLPDMNGLDMCARIRGLPKHGRTPIIFLTGDDSAHNRERGAIKGVSDFIAKPFNMFELTLKAHTWALKNRLEVA